MAWRRTAIVFTIAFSITLFIVIPLGCAVGSALGIKTLRLSLASSGIPTFSHTDLGANGVGGGAKFSLIC